DSTDNKAYLVVDSPYFTSTFITLWTVEDPLGANPIVSAVNIPTTAAYEPPDGNQLGDGTPRIDSGRRTYRNAVYQDGSIWTATAVAGGTNNQYAFARYVRLDAINQTLLEDVSFGADGYYYLYPAVMVDENNNLVMVFTRTGDNEYAGAAYTGRKGTSPPQLSGSVLLKPGEARYIKTFGGTRNRWGDYLGIAQDPANPGMIWGLIEYAASPENTWGTWVGAFTYLYRVIGEIQDINTNNPIEFATLEVVETGRTIVTDSTGQYSFGSPQPNVTLNVSAFAYQDTSLSVTIPPNFPIVLDIQLQPEVEAILSGQIVDPNSGEGIEASLEFYAHGNPYPGPWATATSDSNGNFSISTIIGTYDILITPEIPYPITRLENVVLDTSGTNLTIEIEKAAVFLVNDDVVEGREVYLQESLDDLGVTYYTWNVMSEGVPDSLDFNLFPS
ncbi:MAG: carboxypeptidase-like regulatory domain-containing protein, partial [Methanobacteriota archaeon]